MTLLNHMVLVALSHCSARLLRPSRAPLPLRAMRRGTSPSKEFGPHAQMRSQSLPAQLAPHRVNSPRSGYSYIHHCNVFCVWPGGRLGYPCARRTTFTPPSLFSLLEETLSTDYSTPRASPLHLRDLSEFTCAFYQKQLRHRRPQSKRKG